MGQIQSRTECWEFITEFLVLGRTLEFCSVVSTWVALLPLSLVGPSSLLSITHGNMSVLETLPPITAGALATAAAMYVALHPLVRGVVVVFIA